MLKDELELITGTLIAGPVTPTIFRLLKDSPVFDKICATIGVERRIANADTSGPAANTGEVFGSGFDFLRWLTDEGQSVTLPGDDAHLP